MSQGKRVASKILSWDSFVSKTPGVFQQNYQSMIKMKKSDKLSEANRGNTGLVRLAIAGADTRYCGVYFGVIVTTQKTDDVYIVLWDNWKGYVIDKGYATILDDTEFPEHLYTFRDVIKQNLNSTCCWI